MTILEHIRLKEYSIGKAGAFPWVRYEGNGCRNEQDETLNCTAFENE